jgi:hypothetical protein
MRRQVGRALAGIRRFGPLARGLASVSSIHLQLIDTAALIHALEVVSPQ